MRPETAARVAHLLGKFRKISEGEPAEFSVGAVLRMTEDQYDARRHQLQVLRRIGGKVIARCIMPVHAKAGDTMEVAE